jgi:hypothetical protein
MVAALWLCDQQQGDLRYDLSAAEVERLLKERLGQGHQPVEVAGYRQGGKDRYAAAWVTSRTKEDVRWYVGVSDARHAEDGYGPMQKAKLQARTLQLFTGSTGKVLNSALWGPGPAGDVWAADDEETFAGRGLAEGLPLDVSLTWRPQPVIELGRWLAGPWLGAATRHTSPPVANPQRRYAGACRWRRRHDQRGASEDDGPCPNGYFA